MDATKLLVTLPELARRLRVPARWIRQEAEAGRIPHLKAGSQLLFNLGAVETVLAERASPPAHMEVTDGLT
jgi:excisionase family DNA binding protein